jgi:GNAT superfamily N-acetyltransferase
MWKELLAETKRTTLSALDDAGTVCGFASAFTLDELHAGFDCFLQMLYVDESLKRHGLGRALLGAIAAAMRDAGCRSMALRTLRGNPARGFYEHVGARSVPALDIDEGALDDVVYGFDDLSLVADPPTTF